MLILKNIIAVSCWICQGVLLIHTCLLQFWHKATCLLVCPSSDTRLGVCLFAPVLTQGYVFACCPSSDTRLLVCLFVPVLTQGYLFNKCICLNLPFCCILQVTTLYHSFSNLIGCLYLYKLNECPAVFPFNNLSDVRPITSTYGV